MASGQDPVLCWQDPVQISGAVLSFFALATFYAVALVFTLLSKTKNDLTTDEAHAFYKPFNYAREYVGSDFQLKLVVTTIATLAVGTQVRSFLCVRMPAFEHNSSECSHLCFIRCRLDPGRTCFCFLRSCTRPMALTGCFGAAPPRAIQQC